MTPLLERVVDKLRPAATPARPAVIRLGVGAFSAWNNHRRRGIFRGLHHQDPARFRPVGPVKILRRPLPPKFADLLFDAAQLANAAATLGIAHRVSGPLNSALQLWTLSYRNSWGMIYHNDNMLLLQQMVLGLSRSGDALSVDSVIREKTLLPERYERTYGGIPTAVNIAAVTVYLISGVAKVRSPLGWSWAGGTALREQIAADSIRKEVFGGKVPATTGALYRSNLSFGVLAGTALAVELGAPLALIDRRLGQGFVIAAWGMHAGIRVIMGIKFKYNLSGISYLGFFPVGAQLVR
ncbi:hypothetical protein COCCU_02225 [Corynebacterium occultum]|uniref:HTTM domain-containing protein n=1 Tax=Corynebacterium occultum TaxID=2675219 RepID=A0A6B8VTK3_9CORY|nr:hypothetical protein [Corynebacterium occultum]QGU06399.1 hypothetical protein COCCU_02225 [Corynebacterium occultum]